MKYKKIVLSLILATILIFLIVITIEFPTKNDVSINFGKSVGKIKMSYGANEAPIWLEVAQDTTYQNFHKDVNSEYIRTWISAPWYFQSTFPLNPDGSYTWDNLDQFINGVLNSNAIPYVVFAHYNKCGNPDVPSHQLTPFNFVNDRCEAHGVHPPDSDIEFANYVATVVQHFKDKCQAGQYSKQCDVNNWYFEIWNEPYPTEWWLDNPPRYSAMFNIVYPRIKAIVPNAKVGGPGGVYIPSYPGYTDRIEAFLNNSQPDFVSVHHYGNILGATTDEQRIRDVREILYDAPIALRQFAIQKGQPSIEIINSEYSSDHTPEYMSHLGEPFTATWYASALINQIKSQEVDIELFFSGTTYSADGAFGMWSASGKLFPVYHMKKSFVKYNKKGSSILDAQSFSDFLDILAVETDDGKFITIVNKKNRDNSVNIRIINGNFKQLLDLNNNHTYDITNNQIKLTLEPYEVKFLKVKQYSVYTIFH